MNLNTDGLKKKPSLSGYNVLYYCLVAALLFMPCCLYIISSWLEWWLLHLLYLQL